MSLILNQNDIFDIWQCSGDQVQESSSESNDSLQFGLDCNDSWMNIECMYSQLSTSPGIQFRTRRLSSVRSRSWLFEDEYWMHVFSTLTLFGSSCIVLIEWFDKNVTMWHLFSSSGLEKRELSLSLRNEYSWMYEHLSCLRMSLVLYNFA